jgi:hypothetical protein
MKINTDNIYEHFKRKSPTYYDQDTHCRLLLDVMLDSDRGSTAAFCRETLISENTFWTWVRVHEIFGEIYSFCKIYARAEWEKEGRQLRDHLYPMGTISHAFEHWKMVGWSRFGISKNSRIKLNLNPKDSPDKHYAALLEQANSGDFTASEIKQLMEAVNVGLRTHEIIELQKEVDKLKSDLLIMKQNSNADNTLANKGITKADQGSLADSLC